LTIVAVPVSRPTRATCPGDELAAGDVVAECRVRPVRLLVEPHPGAPRVAQRSDEHAREDGGLDRVAHRVGHGDVERVAVDGEVEGVAADVSGRLQPARERELPGFAQIGRASCRERV